MNILVTGGAGFIGTNLVSHLSGARKHKITVLDNLSVGQRTHGLPDQVEFRLGDFTDRHTLEPVLRGIDVVVHLAALSGVVDSIVDPRPSFRTNVAGSFELLEAAREAGVQRFILASTGGALLGDTTPPISERMPPAPLSPYGATKLAIEGYCSAFAGAYSMSCTALRFSNIYGPHSSHKKSVVAAFIKSAMLERPLVVYGDGTQCRDYLYVGDLVHGIEAAIDRQAVGTFQLGSGRPTPVLELIKTLNHVAGKRLPVEFQPARRGEVHSTWCDISKAANHLGFVAPTTLEQGIRSTWEWFAINRRAWVRAKASFSDD